MGRIHILNSDLTFSSSFWKPGAQWQGQLQRPYGIACDMQYWEGVCG